MASRRLPDAETHLDNALQAFTSIGARFEVGRTHLDPAQLARAQGKPHASARHLLEARELFLALRIPSYLERTEHLASEAETPAAEYTDSPSQPR